MQMKRPSLKGTNVNNATEDYLVVEPMSDHRNLLPIVLASDRIGIATIDADLRYRFVNETLASENGFSVQAHIGKTVRQVLGKYADTLEPLLRQAFVANRSISFHVTAKSRIRPMIGKWILNYSPMKGPGCRIPTICAVVFEVTSFKMPDNLEQLLFNLAGKLLYLNATVSRDGGLTGSGQVAWKRILEECAGDVLQTLGSLRGAEPATPEFSLQLPSPVSESVLGLSRRQQEILRLLASNKSNKQIAAGLSISERTVESHRRRVMERLGLHSLGELIHFAIRHHLVEVQ
jgi:DNA-binding CsgD family transcriptional regulator